MPPQYLYRYRPINEFSLWEIEYNAIYLAGLDTLNDRHEGVFDVDYSDIWSVRRNLAGHALKEGNFAYALLCIFVSRSYLDERIRQYAAEYLKEAKHWGVACFTERHDNWHMWEKYADNHKGVVLEYDLSDASLPKNGFRKVQYEDRPRITMADIFNQQNEGGYFDLLSFKDPSEWAKEEEWRLLAPIEPENRDNPKRILRVPLRRAIAGSRASDEDKHLVKQAVNGLDRDVKYAEYEAPVDQESNGVLRDL
jgi:hypothetical protein